MSIVGAAFAVWCTLTAQTLLTTRCGTVRSPGPIKLTDRRIYALTCLNRLVAVCFAFITLVQLVVGLVVASMWNHSGMRWVCAHTWIPAHYVQTSRKPAWTIAAL